MRIDHSNITVMELWRWIWKLFLWYIWTWNTLIQLRKNIIFGISHNFKGDTEGLYRLYGIQNHYSWINTNHWMLASVYSPINSTLTHTHLSASDILLYCIFLLWLCYWARIKLDLLKRALKCVEIVFYSFFGQIFALIWQLSSVIVMILKHFSVYFTHRFWGTS